jgi:nucleoside-triphosphatase
VSIDGRVLLLTGCPGVGKTTALRAAGRALADGDVDVAGFWTEEIRVRGERHGFRAVSFEGVVTEIAHVRFAGGPRVGKYGVDVAAIDAVLPSLAREADVYLVDEIGKMECLSDPFVTAMRRLLDRGRPVVATIAARGGGFIAEVRARRDVAELVLMRANRDTVPATVAAWVRERIRRR